MIAVRRKIVTNTHLQRDTITRAHVVERGAGVGRAGVRDEGQRAGHIPEGWDDTRREKQNVIWFVGGI